MSPLISLVHRHGVSGRPLLEHVRACLSPGQPFTVEGILGTTFTVTIVGEADFAGYRAVIPEVSGQVWITSSG
jgi:Proline racemase